MRFFFLFFLIFFLTDAFSSEIYKRENDITKNLRCLVCEGQSVYESNSDFAIDIKKFVNKELKKNKSNEEIYSFLKLKYGEEILFNPEISLKNIFLWFGPISFFIIGIYILYRKFNVEK